MKILLFLQFLWCKDTAVESEVPFTYKMNCSIKSTLLSERILMEKGNAFNSDIQQPQKGERGIEKQEDEGDKQEINEMETHGEHIKPKQSKYRINVQCADNDSNTKNRELSFTCKGESLIVYKYIQFDEKGEKIDHKEDKKPKNEEEQKVETELKIEKKSGNRILKELKFDENFHIQYDQKQLPLNQPWKFEWENY